MVTTVMKMHSALSRPPNLPIFSLLQKVQTLTEAHYDKPLELFLRLALEILNALSNKNFFNRLLWVNRNGMSQYSSLPWKTSCSCLVESGSFQEWRVYNFRSIVLQLYSDGKGLLSTVPQASLSLQEDAGVGNK
ncbi:MAG: hypothetical protein V5A14_02640 [Desulfohalobiaceae bacterium]